MKKSIFTFLFISLLAMAATAQQTERKISIIPEPEFIVEKDGYYVLPDEVVVACPFGSEAAFVTALLKEKLSLATGKKVVVKRNSSSANIELLLNRKTDKEIGDEGYKLYVTQQKISIRANKPAGLLYGVQTFFQLLPPQIESNKREENVSWQVPFVEITDYPLVEWRGMMLDVSRHFFTVSEVKRFIDNMVKYKY
ncbi:MAG: beta-N-acetylhexosaminidase, partial [Proteiniphilum sp.]|nr:beta-N-acetylhexosaminidase [Proteiniphilum sp.]